MAEALVQIAEASSEAVTSALEMLCPGAVSAGEIAIPTGEIDPLDGVALPAVSTYASYVNGVTGGGNLFTMSRVTARRLAAAMMGQEQPDEDAPLSELESSALSEAMGQVMSAAAAATAGILGQDVNISQPETHLVGGPDGSPPAFEKTPHAASVPITILGEPCRLVQLVPNAFLVRMTRALDERRAEHAGQSARSALPGSDILAESLSTVPVRVCAELGRTRMPAGHVVGLPLGTVVDLDREVDEPIDLYVNGLPFAKGRLVTTDGSDWAVQIESVVGDGSP